MKVAIIIGAVEFVLLVAGYMHTRHEINVVSQRVQEIITKYDTAITGNATKAKIEVVSKYSNIKQFIKQGE